MFSFGKIISISVTNVKLIFSMGAPGFRYGRKYKSAYKNLLQLSCLHKSGSRRSAKWKGLPCYNAFETLNSGLIVIPFWNDYWKFFENILNFFSTHPVFSPQQWAMVSITFSDSAVLPDVHTPSGFCPPA
jgi:hypothetical protein